MNQQERSESLSVDDEFLPSEETRMYMQQKDDKESTVGSYLFGSNVGLSGAFNGVLEKPKLYLDPEYDEHETIQKQPLATTDTQRQNDTTVSPTKAPSTRANTLQKEGQQVEQRKESLINLEAVQQQMEALATKAEAEGEIDDKIVNMLCEHADGFEILSKRVKETLSSTKDVSGFLKKRAQIEESYAQEMQKLCSQHAVTEGGKAGSYGEMWQNFIKMHTTTSKMREKFASNLNEMAENIEVLHRNTARGRKQLKEASNKLARELNAAATQLETSRAKFELASEDWEKTQGNDVKKQKQVQKGLNAFQNLRVKLSHDLKFSPKSEEEARTRAALASENYKVNLHRANGLRKDYYSRHLPRFVKGLKDTNQDCDEGLQKYLIKYGQAVESLLMEEATTINPLEPSSAPGLLSLINLVSNFDDFTKFLEVNSLGSLRNLAEQYEYISYVSNDKLVASPTNNQALLKGSSQNNLSGSKSNLASPIYNPKSLTPTVGKYFGSTLAKIMAADPEMELVPRIVTTCISYVEAHGLNQEGIYRVSGLSHEVAKLRLILDNDPTSPLDNVVEDVHSVSGVLKLFFRELTDPLFPRSTYKEFIAAAKQEESREKLLMVHSLINDLPDPNYATLRDLSWHLLKVTKGHEATKMNATNLGIVFGPTLMDSGSVPNPSEFKYQSELVQFIIENCDQIFEE